MRKASMVLGIIGGSLAIFVALFTMLGGVAFSYLGQTDVWTENIEEATKDDSVFDAETVTAAFEGPKFAANVFLVIGAVIFISGVLGIIGGAIVNKNNIAAGVLMLLGGMIALFTLWAFISFILLLLGGIFALVKDTSGNKLAEESQAQ